MRRRFYIGLGIFLLIIAPLFGIINDLIWLAIYIIPLICLYIYDVTQKNHTILRNFPILGHIRYIMEFFRPEIQQYFIADDKSERPYDRETRMYHQRAKGLRDTVPFGTDREILANNYEWILHSLNPVHVSEVEPRITFGGPDCKAILSLKA